jgi:hypothetical protein
VTEYSSVTIQGNPCQNQLELANSLPQLYTKIKLIQGNKHLNAINVCSKAISNMSAQISGHVDSAISQVIEKLNAMKI